MYKIKRQDSLEKNYQLMAYMSKRVLEDDQDLIASLSNISAIINGYMEKINWVGFYLLKEGNENGNTGDELVLGPFQGLPACIRIPLGKGVCGTAASTMTTQVVADVSAFPGHIACDSASQSEIVIPICKNGKTVAVLDVDSPILSRFGPLEEKYLTEITTLLEKIF